MTTAQKERWIQPGQFSLILPANWLVSQTDRYTEIRPKAGDGAIHISSFNRPHPAEPSPDDAALLVENFARKNQLKAKVALRCATKVDECSCIGHFSGSGLGAQPSLWVLKASVGIGNAALASFCLDDAMAKSYDEGMAILASLRIEQAHENQ
jgi:hypothetical protein